MFVIGGAAVVEYHLTMEGVTKVPVGSFVSTV